MKTYSACVLGAGGVGKSCLTLRYINDDFSLAYDPTLEDTYQKTVKTGGENVKFEVLDTAGSEQFAAVSDYNMKKSWGFVLVFSLTQANTLRDVERLRTQIFRAKGLPTPPSVGIHEIIAGELGLTHAPAIALRPPPTDPRGSQSHPYHPYANGASNGSSTVIGSSSSHRTRNSGGMVPNATSASGQMGHQRRRSSQQSDIYEHAHSHYAFHQNPDKSPIPIVLVGTKCDLTRKIQVKRDTAVKLAKVWNVPYYETSSLKNRGVDEAFSDILRQMQLAKPDGHQAPKPRAKGKKKRGGVGCIIM